MCLSTTAGRQPRCVREPGIITTARKLAASENGGSTSLRPFITGPTPVMRNFMSNMTREQGLRLREIAESDD